MNKIKLLFGKLLCKLNIHKYWINLRGNEPYYWYNHEFKCTRCNKIISEEVYWE